MNCSFTGSTTSLTSTSLSSQDCSGAEREIGDLDHIGDDAAGDRRDCLLPQRRIGDEAVVDLVAARLLVIGGHRLEGRSLPRGQSPGRTTPRRLSPPRWRYGPRQGPGRSQRQRAAKHRAPGQDRHARLSFPVLAREPKRTRSGCCLPAQYRTPPRYTQMLIAAATRTRDTVIKHVSRFAAALDRMAERG